MSSPYASQVNAYGCRWHRPWLALFIFATLFGTWHWVSRERVEEPQVVCKPITGSRFWGAVEIDGLIWTADLEAALACGFEHDRLVLVAIHAVTDTNARVNEVTIFCDRKVQAGMKKHVLLMLFADVVPDQFYRQKPGPDLQRKDGEANQRFAERVFETAQEPLYAVLQPTGNGNFKIVGVYDEARINDPKRFVGFLRNPRAVLPERAW